MGTTQPIDDTLNHLFRAESGKMVAVLIKIFGIQNIGLAEDVVQEALLAAMESWKFKGLPDNPRAWLYRVAKNKAIDQLRKRRHDQVFDFTEPGRILLSSEYTLQVTMDDFFDDQKIQNDFLAMMFACCHPEIHIDHQITFILKSLCGFSTREVARAFLTEEATISKRIYRTKTFFKEERMRLAIPEGHELENRSASVLQAIYQIFNEGYKATHSDQLVRKDLIAQALQLGQALLQHPLTRLPEVYALMALMCYHAARSESRVGQEGQLVLLKDQDRSQWNQELIHSGHAFLNKAAFGERVSRYHIEAALAYEHCAASSYDNTNWQAILGYYDLLLDQGFDAVVYVNRCMALLEASGVKVAKDALQKVDDIKVLQKYYLYHAAWGELYLKSQEPTRARRAWKRALDLTQSPAERKLLENKMQQLEE
ncbi:RNA polymerase sigma factor [Reichenbachiella ulvae]|uniref:RNA polymerase sigma factor n=1 Tax=Reichenbachiella ulvae TaxID=2980104 RepID=A0ABT3CTM5_9BACT|nr:sigma-70 family RNA polymerase sigma factor [Reichenbachiella ulvae]MCV9386947.1 sigma-70 family RNA polymerase sigma factor [Reichenbachiella ulvae]